MKLIEALKLAQAPAPPEARPFHAYLACGFEPLHLRTFLVAQLRRRLPAHAVALESGNYGDCAGNLRRALQARAEATFLALEWADLDPRLGLRELGGWNPGGLDDVVATASAALRQLLALLREGAGAAPVAVSLPTLPPAPLWPAGTARSTLHQAELHAALATFAAEATRLPGVRLVGTQQLDARSPLHRRRDFKSELGYGFPYSLEHADVLADLLAEAAHPTPPLKGLITDLDDTVWRGLLGEVGAAAVRWDLEGHGQVHGLYQQLLAALAEAGVLLAVASKNDPDRVREAFARPDLLLPLERVFPVEAHWQPKSASVRRILEAWNIGADSVAFVDDSPMELAEVAAAFPQIHCYRFPAGDPAAVLELLYTLRDRFARDRVSAEDRLRLESLRAADRMRAESDPASAVQQEEFLAGLDARLVIAPCDPSDPRPLELVNKTNQFNLNGRRIPEAEWRARLEEPDHLALVVSYQDRFGALGKVAVLAGRRRGPRVELDTWVMSCRAFARRIEHRCLALLFALPGSDTVREVSLDFAGTPRNGPLREFLAEVFGYPPAGPCVLTAAAFQARCPPLSHQVESPLLLPAATPA